jgi:hypothetical protein
LALPMLWVVRPALITLSVLLLASACSHSSKSVRDPRAGPFGGCTEYLGCPEPGWNGPVSRHIARVEKRSLLTVDCSREPGIADHLMCWGDSSTQCGVWDAWRQHGHIVTRPSSEEAYCIHNVVSPGSE